MDLKALTDETRSGEAAHLHGAGRPRGALSDVEEASTGRLRLSLFGCGASEVDDHGFALEQAHQVCWLLPLSHPHLVKSVRQGH